MKKIPLLFVIVGLCAGSHAQQARPADRMFLPSDTLWGFAQFDGGKPADEAMHKTCFPCHEPAKGRDFVFTHYAP